MFKAMSDNPMMDIQFRSVQARCHHTLFIDIGHGHGLLLGNVREKHNSWKLIGIDHQDLPVGKTCMAHNDIALLVGDGKDLLRMMTAPCMLWRYEDATTPLSDLMVIVFCANKLFESKYRKPINEAVLPFLSQFRQGFFISHDETLHGADVIATSWVPTEYTTVGEAANVVDECWYVRCPKGMFKESASAPKRTQRKK